MSSERPTEQSSERAESRSRQMPGDRQDDSEAAGKPEAPEHRSPATVLVRGETIRDPEPDAPPNAASAANREKGAAREVSQAKIEMQSRLPALPDDAEVGVQKEQRVVRDGKADLAFIGTLLACAAPPAAPKGHWQEYRVYETNGGKHVFSKVTRSVFAEEQDRHEAEVFEPSPSSVSSQLLRSARELTRARPVTWADAAVNFFGYDPLAKALYRKLGDQFDEHIS